MRVSRLPDSPDGRVDPHMKIEDIIAEQGVYVSTTFGVSMYPMLRHRRDTIVISPVSGRLKKHDVPLYKRGDRYVLHRIIKVLPDSYVIRGDNCLCSEHGITDGDIIGVLTAFYRRDKLIDMNSLPYKLYVRLCRISYPFRLVYYIAKRMVLRMLKLFRSDNRSTGEG